MSLPPKDNDLVGILDELERQLRALEFTTSNRDFDPGTGIMGPQGATGATGPAGSDGADGNTILNGSGAPSSGTGEDGDFYLDTSALVIYGPKASGSWPSGTTIVGPQGDPGPQGTSGNDLIAARVIFLS